MAAVPIYVWNGTAWQETGPVIPASPIKYQASAPSSPSTGDIWVDSDGDVTTGSQQFQRFRFVASGGETSISGVDANGATLAYTAGTEIVALNGSTLVRGQDYTATNGTSITGLSPALVANDVVEVFSFMAFNVANTYTQSQVDGLLENYMGMRLLIPASATNGTIGSTGAVTFTTQSSVSLNDVFTSTYDNYVVHIKFTAFSADASTFVRLRKSGTDATGSNYYFSSRGYTAAGVTFDSVNNPTSDGWFIQDVDSGSSIKPTFAKVEFLDPKVSGYTSAFTQFVGSTTAGVNVMQYGGGQHNVSDSYDGFTIRVNGGTMSGTVRVYGYKN